MMQDTGILSASQILHVKDLSKDVWHGAVAPWGICKHPNMLNFCNDFSSIVSFEALLLLNHSR